VVSHLAMFRQNFRLLIAYFPSFAPLAPLLLGVTFARQLGRRDLPRHAGTALTAVLAGVLTISMVTIRHPLLPDAVIHLSRPDAIDTLASASGRLRELVPWGERVFLFSEPVSAYLAGLDAPPQQFMSAVGTLAPESGDPGAVAKSGAWGTVEINRWLGDETRYAIISEAQLRAVENARPQAVARIRALLSERFSRIGSVEGSAWLVFDVYRRRS
jgi:hypothetical protein